MITDLGVNENHIINFFLFVDAFVIDLWSPRCW